MNPYLKLRGAVVRTFLVLCLPTWASSAFAQEQPVVPQPYPVDRYEPLWKKSPFTLASAAPESAAGFAENLALVGLIQVDNEYFAAVIDKTTQKRELISSKPSSQGLTLARAEASDDLTKVAVVLKKDGESSTLHYDMAFLEASVPKAAAVTGQKNPDPNANRQQVQKNPGGPPPSIPLPRRRIISSGRPQANGNSNATANPAPNSNGQPKAP